jgi:hypothetical protein
MPADPLKNAYSDLIAAVLGGGPYAYVTVNPDLTTLRRTVSKTDYFVLGTELIGALRTGYRLDAYKTFWLKFINRLNGELYGVAYKTKKRALSYVGVLENEGKGYSVSSTDFHTHLLFDVAAEDYINFCNIFRYCWSRYVYIPHPDSSIFDFELVDELTPELIRYFPKQLISAETGSDRFFFHKFTGKNNDKKSTKANR